MPACWKNCPHIDEMATDSTFVCVFFAPYDIDDVDATWKMRKYGDGISMRKYVRSWGESIKMGMSMRKYVRSLRKYKKVLSMRKLVWVWESMSEVEVEKVFINIKMGMSMRKYVRSWESMRKY